VEQDIKQSARLVAAAEMAAAPLESATAPAAKLRMHTLLAIPVATIIGLTVHWLVSGKELPVETKVYYQFLGGILGLWALCAAVQPFWSGMRRWLQETGPIVAVTIIALCVWEIITSGLRLLPMPYFPSPAGVLQKGIEDKDVIFDSTWHSLFLLAAGYGVGVALGLITGICIGWFSAARYWGMPVLKVVGPIPATAWIPLAMIVSPSAMFSAVGLIAIAVWFPVSMLTISGISNTRAS
jgi:NitT/TauT family transport system permease protein